MEGKQCPVIYFCGTGKVKNVWFRVYLNEDGKSGKKKKIYPIAESATFIHSGGKDGKWTLGGKEGSWTVIGDDIYWVAGNNLGLGWQRCLLKHNAESFNPSGWELESRVRILPRAMPFVTAVGSKLFVVAGTENEHPNVDWSKGCGEIYDTVGQSWEYLNVADMMGDYNLGGYDSRNAAVLVSEDKGEPTGIVFYSFVKGSMLFLDLASGVYHTSGGHDSFAALGKDRALSSPPEGLEDCDDMDMLDHVTRNIRAVFRNDTLFWFGYDLRLYGYDVSRRRWFRSPSLGEKLGTLKPMSSSECSNCPVLVGLPTDGKFVVIVSEDPGEITMASLVVVKEDESLSVSVECIRTYFFDDYPSFVPYDGMAM